MKTDTDKAKRVINALKYGLIPDVSLDLLCTGREGEIKELEACLDDLSKGNGAVKFVSGEYGSGKSFMLDVFAQLAVRQGFLAARTVINKSFDLSSLESLYCNVMHNLSAHEGNSQGTGFEEIFDLWVNRLQSYTDRGRASDEIRTVVSALNDYNRSFARAFLEYIKAKTSGDTELSNAAASWIKGEKDLPSNLKARFEVKGDGNRRTSMDLLKAFIKLVNLLGYKGVVVLVDELELLMNIRSDLRKSAYENLGYLVDSVGEGGLLKCMFIFAAANEFFEDPEKGMSTYPALYQKVGYEAGTGNNSLQNKRKPVMRLEKLDPEGILELTDKIIAYHKEAYGWSPKISNEAIRNSALLEFKKVGDPITSVNTRLYTTKLAEILDIMEQNPEAGGDSI